MEESLKQAIRARIAEESPEHLGGFDEGWLEIRETRFKVEENDLGRGDVVQVFSNENGFKKLVTTLIT